MILEQSKLPELIRNIKGPIVFAHFNTKHPEIGSIVTFGEPEYPYFQELVEDDECRIYTSVESVYIKPLETQPEIVIVANKGHLYVWQIADKPFYFVANVKFYDDEWSEFIVYAIFSYDHVLNAEDVNVDRFLHEIP